MPLMLNMASFLYSGKFHTQRHFIKDENIILESEELTEKLYSSGTHYFITDLSSYINR